MGRITFTAIVLLLFVQLASAAEPIDFSRDVLPILSDNCFECHGPDKEAREADLRLDIQEGALRTEAPVIVSGQNAKSELIHRVTSTDVDAVMPPLASKRKLTAQQIDILKRWIDEGATWGKHWAFVAPRRPELPAAKNSNRARNPIDRFILARLEREGLTPSAEASRETLIRRVTLDLTGLPPMPAEVGAFLADRSPGAYEKVVDRLLKSPRFGERMVWDWLDAARYADTNGYQGDPTRSMYFWRDWVIAALNSNMPFDRFTIEQLAGDLLPEPSQDQLVATGFHRNHMINGEGGRIAEESRVDYVQDRVETTGTVWMGLTFNCCRCHDHKYDPLLQKEYYQFSAYFNSIEETGRNDARGLANPIITLSSPAQKQQLERLRTAERDANKKSAELSRIARSSLADWEESLRGSDGNLRAPQWDLLSPGQLKASNGTELVPMEDGGILAQGKNADKSDYEIHSATKPGRITGFKLEALPHESFVNKGPGRANNGNFVLSEITVKVGNKPVKLSAVQADFAQKGLPLVYAVDGKLNTGWAILPQFGQPHTATFRTIDAPDSGNGGNELSIRLAFQFGRQHAIGRFKLYATRSPQELIGGLPKEILALLNKPAKDRTVDEKRKLTDYRVNFDPRVVAARVQAEQAKRKREAFERSFPRTMVMRDRKQPRDTFVLVRGAYNKYADKVSHGVPSILPPLRQGAPANRLALANWLVDSSHPLTARVTVNRYWQTLFGTGLVKTAENFGIQGERPSHPELLDWLATEFMQPTVDQPTVKNSNANNTWNVNHILRLIVTSATYRQSSKLTPSLLERDPDNRLLARGARYRLPSWMIRDQALAASGLLVEKLGGPPVKGYQPTGIWAEATFGKIRYAQDRGESLYRRSLYQFWRRIVGPTMFFDVAKRQTCEVKVARTNTPLHALVTLNDVTYVEAARALAQRVIRESAQDDAERINNAFRRLTARQPTARELAVLTARLRTLRQHYQSNPESAQKLIATGESKPDEKLDPIELAAWTGITTIILNLDETITKE